MGVCGGQIQCCRCIYLNAAYVYCRGGALSRCFFCSLFVGRLAGKTIEIINTDAEGRLTLADALVYADKLNVDAIIDLATLTDAAVTALGVKMAALYSNSVQLRKDLLGAATRADEGVGGWVDGWLAGWLAG